MSTSPRVPEKLRPLFDNGLAEKLVALRENLHRHPELSFHEERTGSLLYDELKSLDPAKLDRVAKTGVIARIAGRDPKAPVVAIRGDIDALPIHEETGFDWASENDGVMHACGHDVHASWTIGAAHLLAREPAEGDVLVLLQPAEEIGLGAPAVLESGALDEVKAIFGAHVDRRFAVGEVVAQEGPLAASAETFEVRLRGVGGHGARPHEANDPIVGLGALVTALQTIVSRRLNPAHPGVVTIGKVHAGTAPNIIPEEALVAGTLRATDADTRALLADSLREISESIADAYGLRAAVRFPECTPPIVNPPETVAYAREAAIAVLGKDSLRPLGFLNMGGEDFGHYMQAMPGCFIRIGAREEGAEVIPAHSPYFYADEGSIFVGAAVLAETARRASAGMSTAT